MEDFGPSAMRDFREMYSNQDKQGQGQWLLNLLWAARKQGFHYAIGEKELCMSANLVINLVIE